jgi:hypothetical protein
MLEVLHATTKEAPVERYVSTCDEQQYVGIDLHVRREGARVQWAAVRRCG